MTQNNIYFADYGDKLSEENWQLLINRYPESRKVSAGLDRKSTCQAAAALNTELNFWLIDGHCRLLDSFDLYYASSLLEYDEISSTGISSSSPLDEVYAWKNTDNNHDSLDLLYVSTTGKLTDSVIFVDDVAVQKFTPLYDIIIINYGRIIDTKYPNAKQVTAQLNGLELNKLDTWKLAAKLSDTIMFWLIDSNITVLDSFDLSIHIPNHDTQYVNQWPEELLLIPKYYDFSSEIKFKHHKGLACIREKQSHVEIAFDKIFLSYNEPNAIANFEHVKKIIPDVKHIHSIKGVFNAHKAASQISNTEWFWVIDGDNYLLDTFDFTIPKNIRHEPPGVFVFACRNNAIEITYGNGGIKLMHKSLFDMNVDQYVDLTTSFENFTYIDTIASETHIDSDEYNAWRAAFRECTKLSTNIIKNSNDSINRIYLNAWLYASNSKYSDYIRLGAAQGQDWARNNPDQLHLINDYAWLEQYYKDNK